MHLLLGQHRGHRHLDRHYPQPGAPRPDELVSARGEGDMMNGDLHSCCGKNGTRQFQETVSHNSPRLLHQALPPKWQRDKLCFLVWFCLPHHDHLADVGLDMAAGPIPGFQVSGAIGKRNPASYLYPQEPLIHPNKVGDHTMRSPLLL